jgi:hypothetical protein
VSLKQSRSKNRLIRRAYSQLVALTNGPPPDGDVMEIGSSFNQNHWGRGTMLWPVRQL